MENKQPRINHQIRISPVRLISAEGEQLGVLPIEEARAIARERGLDLVEVAPNARPVVVRMMDFGRWKYEQAKNQREAKKREHQIQVKQIKYRPFVDDNDFRIKTNKAREFLEEGHKVKITVMFRRRAMRRPENGYKIIQRVADDLADVAKVEFRPREIVNRDLTMVLAPINPGVPRAVRREQRPNEDELEEDEDELLDDDDDMDDDDDDDDEDDGDEGDDG